MICGKYISKCIIVWDISTKYYVQYAAVDPLLCIKVVSYFRSSHVKTEGNPMTPYTNLSNYVV
jgi:hypothetical protein